MSSYIMKDHRDVIASFAKEHNVAISFREAGEDTITRLYLGCPCKGHEVLEKSIKKKSLSASNVNNKVLGVLENHISKLNGLIGHWSPTNNNKIYVEGVYLSEYGVKHLKSNPFLKTLTLCKKITKDNTEVFYPNIVNITMDLCEKLNIALDVEKEENYNRFFLTGDYDIHDMIMKSGKNSYLVFDPDKEKELQENLNFWLRSKAHIFPRINDEPYRTMIDEETKKKVEINIDKSRENELNFIRHGAQVNYPSHMLNHEPHEILVPNVVLPDLNLEAVDMDGTFSLIHTLDELRAWYSRNGATIKHTYVTNRDDNTVVNRLLNRNQPMDVIIKNTVSLLRKYLMGFDTITYPCELNKAQNPLYGYITDFYYHLINTLPKLDEKKDNRDLPMLMLLDEKFVDTSLAKINDFKNIRKESENPMCNALSDYAEHLQAIIYETQTTSQNIL